MWRMWRCSRHMLKNLDLIHIYVILILQLGKKLWRFQISQIFWFLDIFGKSFIFRVVAQVLEKTVTLRGLKTTLENVFKCSKYVRSLEMFRMFKNVFTKKKSDHLTVIIRAPPPPWGGVGVTWPYYGQFPYMYLWKSTVWTQWSFAWSKIHPKIVLWLKSISKHFWTPQKSS